MCNRYLGLYAKTSLSLQSHVNRPYDCIPDLTCDKTDISIFQTGVKFMVFHCFEMNLKTVRLEMQIY